MGDAWDNTPWLIIEIASIAIGVVLIGIGIKAENQLLASMGPKQTEDQTKIKIGDETI